jgi:arylsulfatase A
MATCWRPIHRRRACALRARLRRAALVPLLIALAAGLSSAASAAQRPNIIFILADDLGYGDVGVTHQNARAAAGLPAVATPNIDSIALNGARFNNFYAGGVNCSPSRNAMLTGFHQRHAMFEQGSLATDIRPGEQDKTWGQVLQEAGYATGMFGKWHLGGVNDPSTAIRTPSALPTQKGFTTAYGPMQRDFRMAFHWESDGQGGMRKVATPAEPTWTGSGDKNVFGDSLVANRAAQYIRQQAAGSQPFAAYVPFLAPHIPVDQVPKDHPYANMASWPQVQRDYAGMIWYLDKHVGQILAAVNDPNNDGNTADSIAQDTMIVFTSDNGALAPGTPNGFNPYFFESNINAYGFKNMSTEGGIHIPFFVQWAGTIQPETQHNALGSFADVMPTLAELAGQTAPLGIDGRSLVPEILGARPSDRPDSLTWGMVRQTGPGNPPGWAVRVGDWKLIKNDPNSLYPEVTYRLFNLAADPRELTNRASQRPDIVAALTAIGVAEGSDSEPYAPPPDNPAVLERFNTYFTQYKSWNPQGASTNFAAAANWSGGTQYNKPNDPQADNWNTGPALNWLATVYNTTASPKQASVGADASVLALELRGAPATMTLNVDAEATLTARNGLRILGGGILRLHNGEINTIRDIEIAPGGRFEGEGLIDGQQAVIANIPEFAGQGLFEPNVVNRGVFSVSSAGDPVQDAGQLTVNGDYLQFGTGVLQMNVFANAGTPGQHFDQLAATGSVELNGFLSVTVANSSSFALGDSFPLITAEEGVSGFFKGVNATPLPTGLAWSVEYTSHAALLKVVDQSGSGGPLDFLSRWRRSFGVDAGGDLDGDDDTDGNDFLMWQRSLPPNPPAGALRSVPEPSAGVMPLVFLTLLRRRRADASGRCLSATF